MNPSLLPLRSTFHVLRFGATTLGAGALAAAAAAWLASLGQLDAALLAFGAGFVCSAPALGLLAASEEVRLAIRLPRLWSLGWRPGPLDGRGDAEALWTEAERVLAVLEGRAVSTLWRAPVRRQLRALVEQADRLASRRHRILALLAAAQADASACALSRAQLGSATASQVAARALAARDTSRARAEEALVRCDADLASVRAMLLSLRTRLGAAGEREEAGRVPERLAEALADLHDRAGALEEALDLMDPHEPAALGAKGG